MLILDKRIWNPQRILLFDFVGSALTASGLLMNMLEEDILSFEQMRAELEAEHNSEWVLFRCGRLVGVYDDFEAAALDATERFDEGPYLLRQVGAPQQVQLTGGMIFTRAHA